MPAPPTSNRARFGDFVVDLRTGELFKNGTKIRLPVQRFQVLALLLQRPGEMVTREELRQKLWPEDTFVDFDDGLNTAIRKLRQVLGDSPEIPKYIETLPRRGYRLIARVEVQSSAGIEGAVREVPAVSAAHRRWMLWGTVAALAGLAAAVAATGLWWALHKNAPIPIAVLPLVNLSQDPGNEYFADGLTGEIIRDLSIIDGLVVRSQTSSFALKGKARSVGEAGRQLEADFILEGSVARNGQQLRINAQLIRARDDVPIWSGKFDRELTDILAIQEEISRGIVNSLRLKLGRGRRRYETSTEAYDLYLRARALETRRLIPGDDAIDLFEKAVAKDSSFAPAYAGLADAYAWRTGAGAAGTNDPNHADALEKMRAAAEKAIQVSFAAGSAHRARNGLRTQWAVGPGGTQPPPGDRDRPQPFLRARIFCLVFSLAARADR